MDEEKKIPETTVKAALPPDHNYCPICGKPLSSQSVKKNKENMYIAIIVIFVVIMVSMVVSATVITLSNLRIPGGGTSTDYYSANVTIAKNGFYEYSVGYYTYIDDITLNVVSKDGRQFDFYLMDSDQYNAVYGNHGQNATSFSTHYSQENVTQYKGIIHPQESWGSYLHIIIDNMDNSLTPGDAVPVGSVLVQFDVVCKYTSSTIYD